MQGEPSPRMRGCLNFLHPNSSPPSWIRLPAVTLSKHERNLPCGIHVCTFCALYLLSHGHVPFLCLCTVNSAHAAQTFGTFGAVGTFGALGTSGTACLPSLPHLALDDHRHTLGNASRVVFGPEPETLRAWGHLPAISPRRR